MSIRVMSEVWDHANLEGAQLLVLLALADFANDDGYCWPSYETLAKKARVSRRYAIQVVKRLQALGYVVATHRRGEDGEWSSNGYIVQVDAIVNRDHQVVNGDHQPSEPQITTLVNPSSPEPSCEPSCTPSVIEVDPREMFSTFAHICEWNTGSITQQQRGQLNQSEKILRDGGATPELLREFRQWWDRNDWRGKKGQPPIPKQVREEWGRFIAWRNANPHEGWELVR